MGCCRYVVFFVGVRGLITLLMHNLSKKHSLILHRFAVGTGAPRIIQELRGVGCYESYVSGVGRYVELSSQGHFDYGLEFLTLFKGQDLELCRRTH